MFTFGKKKLQFAAVCEGRIDALSQYPESVIASKTLGDGYMIIPAAGRIVSPVEGTVMMVYPTLHAIGIQAKDKTEILIHIGVDTVKAQGQGFIQHVDIGQSVDVGTLLVEFDLEKVKRYPEVLSTDVAVIVLDQNKQCIVNQPKSFVTCGQPNVAVLK